MYISSIKEVFVAVDSTLIKVHVSNVAQNVHFRNPALGPVMAGLSLRTAYFSFVSTRTRKPELFDGPVCGHLTT